jgi:RimJ/RimL family protein N-acetyltransferase
VVLHSFDWHSRRAEIVFWLVSATRRRGVGTAAVSLALSWAFAELDLLRVEMTTTPENPAVPALARRLGFSQEGVLRQRNVERGRRVDIIWFGLLREEWAAGRAAP